MFNKMWDEVVAGPQPSHGLSKLRKLSTNAKGAPLCNSFIFSIFLTLHKMVLNPSGY